MIRAGALVMLLALGGCAMAPRATCPAGQSQISTAQLFVGTRSAPVSQAEVRRFVDREVTPRFPEGVSIVDGGPRWTGEENRLLRDAAKVVLIAVPARADSRFRLDAIRRAYAAEFKQTPVLVAPPAQCVAI